MIPMIPAKPLLVGMAALAWLAMPPMAAAQGPIVVLEYPGYASDTTPGLNRDNPFVYDPDHTASHRVQQDETLSHIITDYYAGSGLDLSIVQMAIVKTNKSAFVRGNPNFLYADKLLHLPSLNEMKNLVLGSNSDDAPGDRGGMQNEIFFIGG
jgi:Tfp pilus assembly protein FimV